MDEEQSPAGGEGLRIALIGCCVVAAVLAGVLVGSLGSEGIAGSPIESSLPSEDVYNKYIDPSADSGGSGTGESGLGALNPGDRAGIGGDTGVDSPYASNNTEVHFTVESSQPAYWRTGAYGEYTGTGWERTGGTSSGTDALDHDGIRDERIEYEVTLEQPATGLPTPWRPDSVSGVDSVQVTDGGSIRTNRPLEAGTTFSGVSYAPERDPELLRATEQSYPPELESEYTDLPSGTPGRLETFTRQLTQDADNPYDSAIAIQQWLRTNKEYSLDASRQSQQMADTFIFDMNAGYCEYFATSMAAMLRSQDIPARYVLGYSTGNRIDENTYEVRAMNAHAWVEVYFEDYGWVKFDPTPGGARLSAQEAALESEEPGTEYNPRDSGSPGESFSPGEISQSEDMLNPDSPTGGDGPGSDDPGSDDPGSDDPGSDDPGSDGPGTDDPNTDDGPEYETSLDGTPVPGEEITVTVTYDGEPAPQRTVLFNGEGIGTTGRDGTVTGTVPYEDELRVGVQFDFDVSLTEETDKAYDVSFNRTPRPGEAVELTVTEDGEPVEAMFVEFNGDDVGITDGDGTLTATVPLAGELDVHVREFVVADWEQDEITINESYENGSNETTARSSSGLTSAELAGVSPDGGDSTFAAPGGLAGQDNESDHEDVYDVDTDASLTVSGETVPGAEITVTALVDDSPIRNGSVQIDGEEVGRTDDSGRAMVTLPGESGNVTITVERGSVSTSRTVQLPALTVTVEPTASIVLPYTTATVEASYGNVSAVDAPVMVDGQEVARTGTDGTATVRLPPASSTSISVSQHGLSDTATVSGMLGNLARIGLVLGLLVGGVVVMYTRRDGFLTETLTTLLRLPRVTVAYATWALVTVTTRGDKLLIMAFGRAKQTAKYVASVVSGRMSLGELRAAFLGWASAKRAALGQLLGREEPTDEQPTAEVEAVTVRTAWQRFLDHVSVSQETTHTPGELAKHAIEHDGLPTGPVLTLRDTFREVEYGSRSASDRLESVQEAIEHIENAIEPDEEGVD